MTTLHQRDDRFIAIRHENVRSHPRGAGSFYSMAKAIDRSDEHTTFLASHDVVVSRFALASQDKLGYTIFDDGGAYGLHFFTATVVPWPGFELISNSSINLRTPGSPIPKLPEVEKPSRNA